MLRHEECRDGAFDPAVLLVAMEHAVVFRGSRRRSGGAAKADEDLGGTEPVKGALRNENRRETGARKEEAARLPAERAEALANARHADEKRHGGLQTPVEEVLDETHQSDGVDQQSGSGRT